MKRLEPCQSFHENSNKMQAFSTRLISFLIFMLFAMTPTSLWSHATGQGYIFIKVYQDHIDGHFQLNIDDLNQALDLDITKAFTSDQLQPYVPKIKQYILDRAGFSASGQNFPIVFKESTIFRADVGTYADLTFDLARVTEMPENLQVKYDLFFDKVKNHSGFLIQEYNWEAGILDNESMFSLVFGPGKTTQTLSLTDGSIWTGFWMMVKQGIWHIWIGLDHILFLLALILPSVVRRKDPDATPTSLASAAKSWVPVRKFRPAFLYILKIVTFFTIAHSITLALAALNIIDLPSQLVESIIALSIALAAFHNIYPIFRTKEWIIAFAFGLFHGFGFASVLGEKGLSGEYMVLSLFGFNLGVEMGQVLIICMIFPILFLIRRTKAYPNILTYGSIVLILISFYWAIERIFDVELQAGYYFKELFRAIGLG